MQKKSRAIYDEIVIAELAVQADLLRDLFDPFCRAAPTLRMLKKNSILDLAKSIYEKKLFQKLPFLAHHLQKEGFLDKRVLTHCRSETPHVRGCWVLDLLLGKS
jgi:hypothetical protein